MARYNIYDREQFTYLPLGDWLTSRMLSQGLSGEELVQRLFEDETERTPARSLVSNIKACKTKVPLERVDSFLSILGYKGASHRHYKSEILRCYLPVTLHDSISLHLTGLFLGQYRWARTREARAREFQISGQAQSWLLVNHQNEEILQEFDQGKRLLKKKMVREWLNAKAKTLEQIRDEDGKILECLATVVAPYVLPYLKKIAEEHLFDCWNLAPNSLALRAATEKLRSKLQEFPADVHEAASAARQIDDIQTPHAPNQDITLISETADSVSFGSLFLRQEDQINWSINRAKIAWFSFKAQTIDFTSSSPGAFPQPPDDLQALLGVIDYTAKRIPAKQSSFKDALIKLFDLEMREDLNSGYAKFIDMEKQYKKQIQRTSTDLASYDALYLHRCDQKRKETVRKTPRNGFQKISNAAQATDQPVDQLSKYIREVAPDIRKKITRILLQANFEPSKIDTKSTLSADERERAYLEIVSSVADSTQDEDIAIQEAIHLTYMDLRRSVPRISLLNEVEAIYMSKTFIAYIADYIDQRSGLPELENYSGS